LRQFVLLADHCAQNVSRFLGHNLLRRDEAKRAVDHVQGTAVNGVGLEVAEVDRVLGTHHLTSAHSVENVQLIGREVCLKLCMTLRTARVLELFYPGHDGVAFGGIDRRESLQAEVDRVGDFFLGKFAVNISSTLDDCMVLAKSEAGAGLLSQMETYWAGSEQRRARSLPHPSR
jgi:hypothetical protein